ncbi:ABC transporter substrate-binding protein/permease [Planktothrix agardhii]|uniref:ABC transporter substrate-binding protein/permease n=1 Tax=Planktothrix agardhii TaxID=1160 RepID=UPI0004833BDD|nr:ABC transporter substrate-binding protein/permease [Planktothrix agardhii]
MVKNQHKWVFFLLFGVVLAIVLVLGYQQNQPGFVKAETDQRPTLILVTSSDYPPFNYRDTATGSDEIIGFNIDLAKMITTRLGYEIEILDTDFNGIIPALQSRRADFSIASMVPTEERQKNVDFSDLYYETKSTIVSRKGSNFKTDADLNGKKVGVALASVQEKRAKKIPGVRLETRAKISDLIEEIKIGRLDATLLESTVAPGFVAQNPQLEYHIIPNLEPLGYAIAFPKGSLLPKRFNFVLNQMKQRGEIDQLAKKWLNQPPPKPKINSTPGIFSFAKIVPSLPFILKGIGVTLQFTALSAILGLIWGILLALFKISEIKPLIWFSRIYTSVFRGTPMLLQIAIVYYATPQLTGYNISPFFAGVATFTLNSGAYISETIRAGILSVDIGQREAALSLGILYPQMMVDIIFPQALKNILPALVNQAITLLKSSALVSTIGVTDLFRRAQIVGAEKYLYFEPLLFAGAIYYFMVMILTWIGHILEKRLQRSS